MSGGGASAWGRGFGRSLARCCPSCRPGAPPSRGSVPPGSSLLPWPPPPAPNCRRWPWTGHLTARDPSTGQRPLLAGDPAPLESLASAVPEKSCEDSSPCPGQTPAYSEAGRASESPRPPSRGTYTLPTAHAPVADARSGPRGRCPRDAPVIAVAGPCAAESCGLRVTTGLRPRLGVSRPPPGGPGSPPGQRAWGPGCEGDRCSRHASSLVPQELGQRADLGAGPRRAGEGVANALVSQEPSLTDTARWAARVAVGLDMGREPRACAWGGCRLAGLAVVDTYGELGPACWGPPWAAWGAGCTALSLRTVGLVTPVALTGGHGCSVSLLRSFWRHRFRSAVLWGNWTCWFWSEAESCRSSRRPGPSMPPTRPRQPRLRAGEGALITPHLLNKLQPVVVVTGVPQTWGAAREKGLSGLQVGGVAQCGDPRRSVLPERGDGGGGVRVRWGAQGPGGGCMCCRPHNLRRWRGHGRSPGCGRGGEAPPPQNGLSSDISVVPESGRVSRVRALWGGCLAWREGPGSILQSQG